MHRAFLFPLLALAAAPALAQVAPSQPQPPLPSDVSIARSETRTIVSKINGVSYRLTVFLPSGYDKESKSYPVLYCMDGDWLGPIMAQMSRALGNDIPHLIIVGIDSDDPDHHWADYPTAGKDPHWTVPANRGAANLLRILREEIKPSIDRDFRTVSTDTGIAGHSLGGFFTLYALINAPQAFQHAYASSPSLIWQDNVLLREEETLAPSLHDRKARVFVDRGGLEGQDGRLEALTDQVKARRYPSLHWTMRLPSNESHGTIALADGVDALYAIYGPEPRQPGQKELAQLAGTYRLPDGSRFTLSTESGRLFMTGFRGDPKIELQSAEPGQWFVRYLDYRIEISRGADGRPQILLHLVPTPGPNADQQRDLLAVRD